MLLQVKAVCNVLVQQHYYKRALPNLYNPGKSNDDFAALDVIQKLGAKVMYN